MQDKQNFCPNKVSSYFRAEWLSLTFVTLSGLFYNVGLLATPWFEGRLAQCLTDILGGHQTADAMATLVLAYLLVTLAVQGARFIKRFYVRRFANNINRRMKGILYANLVRESRTSLEKEGAGELMTKAISDVDDCVEGMRKFTTEVFDTGVVMVSYAVMLLIYDWHLALLSLLFTPVSYFCAAKMKKPVQRAGAAYKKAASALSSATLDRVENAVSYRIYGCEEARAERYEGALKNYEKAAVRSNVWQSALPPLYLAASGAGALLILWFGAKNVLGTGWRAWDIGAFTTFLSCFTRLTVKSSKVAKLFNSVQKAEVSWKRIKPLMKSPEALDDLRIPQSADVTLDNLSFTYGDAPIFSGLSLTAHPGDIIGVTGPVACGKSTFGRVFLCEMPYGGSVRFGGKELSSFSPREISGMVGYLGHDPELSMDTIQNNVLCGSRQDVLPRLNAVVLTDEVLAMENGADTVVGSSGARLSGGQAQRLALARTLAHPRPLMILDDPFSALDRKTEDAVFANLQAYAKDKVIFLISHRLYHFPQMQQVIFMEGGKTTVGTHDELMASVPTYRWLYESQTGGKHMRNQKKAGVISALKAAVRSHRILTIGTLLCVAASVVASLIPPLLLKNIIDRLTGGMPLLFTAVLLYFGSLVLEGTLSSAQETLLVLFGQKMTHALRSEMSQKLIALPASTLIGQNPGEVAARFSGDVDAVEALFTSGIISMVADACRIISILAVIAVENTGLALVLLVILPLFAVFTRFVQKRMLAAQLENRRAVAAVSGQVPETLHNIRTIHALGLESYMEQHYDQRIGESYAAMEKTNFYDAIYSPVVFLLNAAVVGIVMLLSASGNADVLSLFGMSVGTSVAIINYISRIFSPIESLGMEIQTIQSAMAGVKRIDAFLNQPERAIPQERKNTARGDVVLSHVTFGYGEKPVLSDFSMTVKEGEQVTLVGRTGAGKSTVFRLLLGLYQPEKGDITIGGVNVSAIPDHERRACIGCVEQHFSRVPGTVLDQITLSDPAITEEMAQNAAKLAGMDDAIRALPDGYNTICTDGMFSQGEWQLLSIARAAAANPAVLLLDEITANLDAETEARVLEALRRASEGRTVLSISHRIYENLGGRTVEIKPYNAYAADSAADCSVKAL